MKNNIELFKMIFSGGCTIIFRNYKNNGHSNFKFMIRQSTQKKPKQK